MDSIGDALLKLCFNMINTMLGIVFYPINSALNTAFYTVLSSAQVINFYNVINSYVLPAAGFFVNIIPPFTWAAIKIFIAFYVSLYSIVMIAHLALKTLRVAKRLIPFV